MSIPFATIQTMRENDDVLITVLCGCDDECVRDLDWETFLHVLDDDGVVPVLGSPLPLKIIFNPKTGRSKAAKIDAALRGVLNALVVRGAVKRVGKTFEATGLFVYASATEH